MTELIQFFSGAPAGTLPRPQVQRHRGVAGVGNALVTGPLDTLVATFRAQYLPQILDQDVAPRVRQEATDAVKPLIIGVGVLAGLALVVALSNRAGAR